MADLTLHTAIAADLAMKHRTGFTQKKIAVKHGVSEAFVSQIAKRLRESQETLADSYAEMVEKEMPLKDRIQRLAQLARGDHAPTAYRALERLDLMSGYLSALDEAQVARLRKGDPMEAASRAVFILPRGTSVGLMAPELREQIQEVRAQLSEGSVDAEVVSSSD